MDDDDPNLKHPSDKQDNSGVSRRDFLKISGISVAVPLVAGPQAVMAAGQQVPVYGPGKVPMEFTINGKVHKASLEPRVTLLDALRDQFELTGAKRVCDRAECGSCTVLVENKPVYACSVLAIEAQHKGRFSRQSLGTGEVYLRCPSSRHALWQGAPLSLCARESREHRHQRRREDARCEGGRNCAEAECEHSLGGR